QRNIVQQFGGLRGDALRWNGIVLERLTRVGVSCIAARIVQRDGLSALCGQVLEVPGAFVRGWNGAVFVEGRGRPLARKHEEEEIMRVVFNQVRNVRHPHHHRAKAVGGIRRLVDLASANRKRLSIQRGIAAIPEDGSVRLVGIEVPEIPASAATSATEPSAAASTKSTASTPAAEPFASAHTTTEIAGRIRPSGLQRTVAGVEA